MNGLKRNISRVFDRLDRGTVDRRFLPETNVLVGTHHKTGTVWLLHVFLKIARKTGMSMCRSGATVENSGYDIFFVDNSRFPPEFLIHAPYRGVHMIRDPRDVIISATFYHQKSKEKWLHVKRDKFGGLSYQDKINSYRSLSDRILFEMENVSSNTITAMSSWDYDDENYYEIKYEDLIMDYDLRLFHDIFLHLGFTGAAIPLCLKAAYDNSLFSGRVEKRLHVRSGKPQQWLRYFDMKNQLKFIGLFGDVLIRLGYEIDQSWVREKCINGRL